jgi:hypothetical protein
LRVEGGKLARKFGVFQQAHIFLERQYWKGLSLSSKAFKAPFLVGLIERPAKAKRSFAQKKPEPHAYHSHQVRVEMVSGAHYLTL